MTKTGGIFEKFSARVGGIPKYPLFPLPGLVDNMIVVIQDLHIA